MLHFAILLNNSFKIMRIFKSDSEYNYHNPPSGLRAVARALQEYTVLPDSLVSDSGLFFSAYCPCGSDTFIVREESGKVYIICSICGYTFVVFDPQKHGKITASAETDLQKDEVEMHCSHCTNSMCNVYLCYYYSDPVEQADRKQEDLFDKFILYATCASCNHQEILISK